MEVVAPRPGVGEEAVVETGGGRDVVVVAAVVVVDNGTHLPDAVVAPCIDLPCCWCGPRDRPRPEPPHAWTRTTLLLLLDGGAAAMDSGGAGATNSRTRTIRPQRLHRRGRLPLSWRWRR